MDHFSGEALKIDCSVTARRGSGVLITVCCLKLGQCAWLVDPASISNHNNQLAIYLFDSFFF